MKRIPVIKFQRDKYGDELLVDVVTLDAIRKSKGFQEVLRQSFYGVMLTTGGFGEVEVDGVSCSASKGLVAFARPGDVCTVKEYNGLTALELIFERDFLLSFFNDPHFIDSLPYFTHRRPSPYLMLDEAMYNKIVGLFVEIQIEIAHDRSVHLLRALLYEVLALLQRAVPVESDVPISVESRVVRFQELVNEHFATETGVIFYAEKLCVSPNYLNRIVQRTLGQSTKAYIQSRRIDEAKHLLRYTAMPIGLISDRLHFDTPSYFVRTFTKETGQTPLQFRNCPEK
ncbi:MAG: helix-turn-helix transcriptional regulator [Bacteroidales bacterium]|nr:helix-turn-helix transcriptional regulator [Bacteroidales bacterium]